MGVLTPVFPPPPSYKCAHGKLAYMESQTICEPSCGPGDYWRMTARFETGSEQYNWLNHTLVIGTGTSFPGVNIRYKVYAIK
jgi:hypothetical protein